MAYPFAAFVVGQLAARGFDRRYLTSVLAMLAGLAVIYACGTTWLGSFARTGAESASIGLQAALAAGVLSVRARRSPASCSPPAAILPAPLAR